MNNAPKRRDSKRRDNFTKHRQPKEKTFVGNKGVNCLLATSMDGQPRLIIYYHNRIVYTRRFQDELEARRFAVEEYNPPMRLHQRKKDTA